jgi:hypothetical protein
MQKKYVLIRNGPASSEGNKNRRERERKKFTKIKNVRIK